MLFGALVAIAVAMVPGLINGILVSRLKVPPFIGTLGMFGVARGVAFLLAGGTTVPVHGRNLRPSSYRGPFPSGAPGNFIDQAARTGARAVLAGAVGLDAFGQVVVGRPVSDGVSDAMIRRVPGLPTGTAHVAYYSDGSRDFVFNMAQSAATCFPMSREAVEGFLAPGRGAACLGLVPGDPAMLVAIAEVCTARHVAGVARSIEPNRRDRLDEMGKA